MENCPDSSGNTVTCVWSSFSLFSSNQTQLSKSYLATQCFFFFLFWFFFFSFLCLVITVETSSRSLPGLLSFLDLGMCKPTNVSWWPGSETFSADQQAHSKLLKLSMKASVERETLQHITKTVGGKWKVLHQSPDQRCVFLLFFFLIWFQTWVKLCVLLWRWRSHSSTHNTQQHTQFFLHKHVNWHPFRLFWGRSGRGSWLTFDDL